MAEDLQPVAKVLLLVLERPTNELLLFKAPAERPQAKSYKNMGNLEFQKATFFKFLFMFL